MHSYKDSMTIPEQAQRRHLGGLYIDLNQYPTNFNETTIRFSDDGFFLLDSEAKWLTTKIMAVSPRHPLMYYAVQHSINNLLRIRNDRFVDPHVIIGEENLHRALIDFQKGANGKAKSHDEVSTGIIAAEITNAPQNKSQVIHSLSYSETRAVDCFGTIVFELGWALF